MDLNFLLLLLFVLYILPELLRLGKKKKTPQPHPRPQAPDRPDRSPEIVRERYAVKIHSRTSTEPHTIPMASPLPAAPEVPVFNPQDAAVSDAARSGKMDRATLINAVMYAEILAAPRAIKPFRARGDWRKR